MFTKIGGSQAKSQGLKKNGIHRFDESREIMQRRLEPGPCRHVSSEIYSLGKTGTIPVTCAGVYQHIATFQNLSYY
jgi:hypothetical protein